MGASTLVAGRLARLFQILLALRGARYPDAGELAERCEVSRRTIYRDLEILRAAGVPVRFNAEHVGYSLAPGFAFDVPRLDECEALALLLSSREAPHLGLGLERDALAGASKLTPGLDAETRQRVVDAASRIDPGAPGPSLTVARRAVYRAIVHGLIHHKALRLLYQEPGRPEPSFTQVEPYQLRRLHGAWILVGRCAGHGKMGRYLVPRIREAAVTDHSFILPSRLASGRPERRSRAPAACGPDRVPAVRLRFSPDASLIARDQRQPRAIEPVGDGRYEHLLDGPPAEDMVFWILTFGPDVEVVEPPELRRRIVETARRILQRHQPNARIEDESETLRA
jgi:predicted DNA-binding transcriptional regulator YafY